VYVWIPGWGFSPAIWSEVRSALGDPPSTVIDLEGLQVLSAIPQAPTNPQTLREWSPATVATALARQLPRELEHPVWVGWSLGGLLALALAHHWTGPQRLVLVASSPCCRVQEGWPYGLRPQDLQDFRLELQRDPAAVTRRFATLCARGNTKPQSLRQRLLKQQTEQPLSLTALQVGLDLLETWDLRALWTDLDAPVAVWWANQDEVLGTHAHRSGPEPGAGAGAGAGAGSGSGSGSGSGLMEALQILRPDMQHCCVPGAHAGWWEVPERLAAFLRETSDRPWSR
jgi:pimeloyl-[acyl-carrier protein] methyl ester esterase